MKKLLKSILFIALFFVSGLVTQNTFAAECTIQSAQFSKVTDDELINGNNSNLTIQSSGCEGGLNIQLKSLNEKSEVSSHRIDKLPSILLPDSTGTLEIELEVDDDTCFNGNKEVWGYNCINFIEIYTNKGQLKFSGKTSNINLDPTYLKNLSSKTDLQSIANKNFELSKQRNKGVLIGNCSGGWCASGDKNWIDSQNWDFEKVLIGSKPDASECNLKEGDVSFSGIGQIITDASPRLTINTSNCKNIPMTLKIVEEDVGKDTYIKIDKKDGSTVTRLKFTPIEDSIKILFKSEDNACDSYSTPDCHIYVEINYAGKTFTTESALTEHKDTYTKDKSYLKKGVIFADCKNIIGFNLICVNEFYANMSTSALSALGITSLDYHWKIKDIQGDQENVDPENIIPEKTVDPESPCFDESTGESDPNCYEFLAPIPGIADNSPSIEDKGGRVAITDLKGYDLGNYINTLFKLAVSILGVMAIIMIIVAGVQYMTVESIYGKSDAKQKIISAVSGLILALGIYTILWTINPQLLEVNFGSGITIVTLDVDGEAIMNKNGTYNDSSGKVISIQGKEIKYGETWPPIGSQLLPIRDSVAKLGISVNNPECQKIGDKGCTSTYFDTNTQGKLISQLASLKAACDCDFVITGGSEVWAHHTHSVSKPILDLRATHKGTVTVDDIKKLNKALSGGQYEDFNDMKEKKDWSYDTEKEYIPGIRAYAEQSGTAPHWHIRFFSK